MKIQHLKISNWQSIINVETDAQDFMVIIGQNNYGKSNALTAILFLLERWIKEMITIFENQT